MSLSTRALIALSVVTSGVYALLIWQGVTHLGADPRPFDLRPFGYDHEDAVAYIAALPEGAVDFYTITLRALDTVFPVLFGIWLGAMTWRFSRGVHHWSRLMLLLPAAAYAMMDLAENALVARILTAPDGMPDPALVERASAYTQSKFATLFVAMAVLLVMIVRTIKRAPSRV